MSPMALSCMKSVVSWCLFSTRIFLDSGGALGDGFVQSNTFPSKIEQPVTNWGCERFICRRTWRIFRRVGVKLSFIYIPLSFILGAAEYTCCFTFLRQNFTMILLLSLPAVLEGFPNPVILNRRDATHKCVARLPQVCRETL